MSKLRQSQRKKQRQLSLFSAHDQKLRLSERHDPLEALARLVPWEAFRPVLERACHYSDGAKGGRPPYDVVSMFKILILAARYNVSDEQMEYQIIDRLSWLRFLDFELGEATPDANTIRLFRERLTKAGAIKTLFYEFDRVLWEAGYIAMRGQIVDATLVKAPKQRNRKEENEAIKAGASSEEIWPDNPAKTAQKDTDARWTIITGRSPSFTQEGNKPTIAIPHFGYKNHISIDCEYGLIREYEASDAARHDGQMLEAVLHRNTGSAVYADTAYRSNANEAMLQARMLNSHIHRKKPRGKPMPRNIAKGNTTKSRIRAKVEHVFAWQKEKAGLFIRTIGLARANAKIGLANIAYNMHRLLFLTRRRAIG